MMKYFILTVCIVLAGCATTDMDLDYKHAVDRANWQACEAVYLAYGKPTFHKGHTHMRIKGNTSNHYVTQDLMSNNCKALLRSGGLWNEY